MIKYTSYPEVPSKIKENLKDYSDFVQKLLFNRGIEDKEEAQKFLEPNYERDTSDPFLILGMEKAVERILSAIKNQEKIIIFGDYDSDGIPGSVILHDFFKKINYFNFENYIPHRQKEGYGLNIKAIENFSNEKVNLLITIDCGITDVAEVERANELGIDAIITDHHLPRVAISNDEEELPKAYAILNSKQKEDHYPDDMLCGAGVSFKLVQALIEKGNFDIKKGWEKWLLDMAGLSTIADMVPLQKENRTLAYFGLQVLRKSRRVGLRALLQQINIKQENIQEGDVGFMISPRINAASRMDIPMKAFDLLATEDCGVAEELASHLNKINDQRKGVVASMVKEAKKKLKEREIKEIIVIGNPQWKPGVLGLLANALMEEYQKTTFVWGRENSEHIKGSCRSDGSLNVVELMNKVEKEIFINIGGHEFAGGFSVSHEKIHLLEEKLLEAYQKIKKTKKEKEIFIDQEMLLEEVTWANYYLMEKLSPFGVGNPQPIFLFNNIEIINIQHFGKIKNHLRINFRDPKGQLISAIGFFMKDDSFEKILKIGQKIKLVANLEKSVFGGRTELRLRIVDLQVI